MDASSWGETPGAVMQPKTPGAKMQQSRKSVALMNFFCVTCQMNQSDSFNTVVAPSIAMRMVCSDLEGTLKGISYGQRRMVSAEILIVL